MKLKTIVEGNDTKAGRAFDIFSQFLILISLISFSIETLPSNSPAVSRFLNIVEIVTVVLFTVEYMLRVIASDRKVKFIFSFYGIIDLIAILPFYISCGIDLRAIRVIRFLRIFRVFKLLRYNRAIHLLIEAFRSIKDELVLFGFSTLLLLFVSSVGIYYFERDAQPSQFCSIFHSFWWAVVTLTTVGYGDMYPITVGGKILTSIVSLLGIGVVAVPTGLVASALTKLTGTTKDDQRGG